MRAITLWPEWAHAVCHLGKRIENRDWPMPRGLVGQPVALHAGRHVGGRPGNPAVDAGIRSMRESCLMASGMILSCWGCGDAVMCRRPDDDVAGMLASMSRPIVVSSVVAVVTFGTPVRNTGQEPPPWAHPESPWWWPITSVRVLAEPVPCRGAQGFWPLPDDVAGLVADQCGEP